jgi:hypothetical protein
MIKKQKIHLVISTTNYNTMNFYKRVKTILEEVKDVFGDVFEEL